MADGKMNPPKDKLPEVKNPKDAKPSPGNHQIDRLAPKAGQEKNATNDSGSVKTKDGQAEKRDSAEGKDKKRNDEKEGQGKEGKKITSSDIDRLANTKNDTGKNNSKGKQDNDTAPGYGRGNGETPGNNSNNSNGIKDAKSEKSSNESGDNNGQKIKPTEKRNSVEKQSEALKEQKGAIVNIRNDDKADAGMSKVKETKDSKDVGDAGEKKEWKNIEPVIDSERVICWGDHLVAKGQRENCKAHADVQMEVFGFKATHDKFQTINDEGKVRKKEMERGIEYIHKALAAKMPVEIGVDSKKPNQEKFEGNKVTNHYVVVVGQGHDHKGNYFTYFDNAYNRPNDVKNTVVNKLYYMPETGTLENNFKKGTRAEEVMGYYKVSQIRKTAKNN